jgi:phosphatidylserine decarboxylase
MANRFRLCRYGAREIAVAFALLGAAGVALWLWVHPAGAAVPAALLLFCLYFFRDPERAPPEGEGLVLAPADGKVMDLEEVEAPEFLGGRALRVGIFLSLFDCHVNRSPVAGRVARVDYRKGRFRAAFNEMASSENESNTVGLVADGTLPDGRPLRVAVRQIAGVIARRIVCAARPEQSLARGERFGMIKFGSRTELYLPVEAGFEPAVRVGDTVRAGLTVMGRLPGRRTGQYTATSTTEVTEDKQG